MRIRPLRKIFVCCLAGAAPAAAAVLTAGPGGTHASLALAVDAANAAPGEDEIRLRTGFHEGGVSLANQDLTITGGWNAAFSQRDSDPLLTTIDHSPIGGTVVSVDDLSDATLRLEGLTLARGEGSGGSSGGLHVRLNGGARLEVRHVFFRDNSANLGGGLFVGAHGDGNSALVDDAQFSRNLGAIYAGGATLEAEADASNTVFEVRESRFFSNRVDNDGTLSGGSCPGLCFVSLAGAAETRIVLEDTRIENNRADGGTSFTDTGLRVSLLGTGDRAELRRNRLIGNAANNDFFEFFPQASVEVSPGNQLFLSDSLVATSVGAGLEVVTTGGITRLVNLTIADNKGDYGVVFRRDAGIVSLANSIVVGSDIDLAGTTEPIKQMANLLGGDPRFVKRGKGNYRLKSNSPAVDKGSKKPPGKLGPTDLDQTTRVKGGKVDIGAYESF